MRIALNATSLLSPLTGIGQYTYQLAKGLREKQEVELDLFYGTISLGFVFQKRTRLTVCAP